MCQDQSARMIIKRGSGVPTIPVSADHRNGDWIATDIYEGEFYQDTDTGLVYQRTGSTIVTASGNVNEMVFKAKFEQVGTSAPVLTIIRNDFGGTITTSRSVAGGYTILGFNSQLTGDFEISFNMSSMAVSEELTAFAPTSSAVAVATYSSGVQSDSVGVGSQIYVTITKYL